jgi:uncharacterized repeat protein (TIGR03803 family)
MRQLIPRLSLALIGILAALPAHAQTATETVLYSFPNANVAITDSFLQANDGNFYGSGSNGIYKFLPTRPGFPPPAQPYVAIHTAARTNADPGNYYGIIQATDGNFYGYAYFNKIEGGYLTNVGQIFKLTPAGTFTTLYTFCTLANCADGSIPLVQLIQGSDGNLYGGTLQGGGHGYGVIFRLSLAGKLTVLHSFCSQSGCADGEAPSSGLIEASDGNFYGSSDFGGTYAGGTVFQYQPSGKFTTLYEICNGNATGDCPGFLAGPYSRMAEATPGTIFQFANSGSIYSFSTSGKSLDITGGTCPSTSNCSNQSVPAPSAYLFPASDGNLYAAGDGGNYEHGTVFNQFAESIYDFCAKSGCLDGAAPAFILQGNDGALYGTVTSGAACGFGGIFRLQPGGSESSKFVPPVNVTAANYNVLAGQSVTLDWTVANAVSTTMQQCSSWLNGASHGKVAPNGTLTFTPSSAGTWIAAVTCGGIETGYATITVTNKQVATTTRLTANSTSVASGANVTLTVVATKAAGTTSVPRGTVTFKTGSLLLGTATLDSTGTATFTASTQGVPAGPYQVVAAYNGDPGDSASTSASVTITVTK